MDQDKFASLDVVGLANHGESRQTLEEGAGGGVQRDALRQDVALRCLGSDVLCVSGAVGAECYDALTELDLVLCRPGRNGGNGAGCLLAEDLGVWGFVEAGPEISSRKSATHPQIIK